MKFVITPPDQVAIPVQGSVLQFPVRRVYCIGRNYAAHAIEMGHNPDREPPFFFCKPADAIRHIQSEVLTDLPYPPKTSDLHYEVEMVVAIGKGGANIAANQAMEHVYGYAVGIDLTRRDRQQEMKDLARPWELGKAFDASAPISSIVPVGNAANMNNAEISLSLNGNARQNGNTAQMIWQVPDAISYLSEYFRLEAGDLIFTGTPEGVGPAVIGDTLTVNLQGVGGFSVKLV